MVSKAAPIILVAAVVAVMATSLANSAAQSHQVDEESLKYGDDTCINQQGPKVCNNGVVYGNSCYTGGHCDCTLINSSTLNYPDKCSCKNVDQAYISPCKQSKSDN